MSEATPKGAGQWSPARWPAPEVDSPSMGEIIDMLRETMFGASWAVETSCGEYCEVEPDGVCCHGHPAWTLRAGLI